MDLNDDASRLLDQLKMLRHPSDLDLLIFFARHPRALLASEHLGTFLGYGAKEIAASLDLLLDAGFLTRTANPRHAARLYVFAPLPPVGDWLFPLLRLASTRSGRLALILALRRRSLKAATDSHEDGDKERDSAAAPLRFTRRTRQPQMRDAAQTLERKDALSKPRTHGGVGGSGHDER